MNPSEHFTYYKKENICNYFWDDGYTFCALSDKKKFIESASYTFSEKKERIEKYLGNSSKKYNLTSDIFLNKSLHKINTYLSKDTIKGLLNLSQLDISKSLDKTNKKYFENEKLIQLFNRYATYNGSSPYKTPGIMSLIPHLEMHFGTYYPKGGMHEISQSIYRLALDKGVKFHFNEKVEKVTTERNVVKGIETQKDFYAADKIICNMDVFSSYNSILKNEKKPLKTLNQERSSSAIIFYWGIKKEFRNLDLHNIFFSNNYQEEFKYIFDDNDISNDPTVYINITSKEEKNHAPKGSENWFVMVNCPGNKGQDWNLITQKTKKAVLKKLSLNLKTAIEPLIETEIILDPIGIEKDTLSHQGSLYGTSSNSKFAAFLRHPNFSQKIKNLYFCGGSAHPGGGIPLCLLSAKIVDDLIPKYA